MDQGVTQERRQASTKQAGTGSAAAETGTEVLSWGLNYDGRLGWGWSDRNAYGTPRTALMPAGTNRKVVGGNSHSVALTSTGEVYTWGRNDTGQLGTGTNDTVAQPQLVYQDAPTNSIVMKATDIAAGYWTTLVLDQDQQTVWAVGSDGFGMLGQGTTGGATSTAVRVDFSKLDPPLPPDYKIIAISSRMDHVLALTDKGQVIGWGNPTQGQLGAPGDSFGPVYVDFSKMDPPLPDGTTIKVIAAGESYSQAITSDDQVIAWGVNNWGQLGSGTVGGQSAVPVYVDFSKLDPPLPGGTTITDLFPVEHSMALTSGGQVLTWGYNEYGQLGTGAPGAPVGAPTYPDFSKLDPPLPGGTTFNAIAGGYANSFAVTSTGQAIGWGTNESGKLGAGGVGGEYDTPTYVTTDPGTTVASIGTGLLHSVAVATPKSELPTQQKEYAWGDDGHGQLGNGYTGEDHNEDTPTAMTLGGPLKDLNFTYTAAGWYHSLAVDTDGNVYACGYNDAGQLGNNDPSFSDNPSLNPVHDLDIEVGKVAGGHHHSLALSKDGTAARAWGGNGPGQLGHGDNQRHPTPVNVLLPAGTYIAIAAGEYHSLALSQDGTVYTWGNNYYGNLGNHHHGPGTNSKKPVQVTGELTGKKVIAIAAGSQHCLAATDDGEVYAWGFNVFGQLGDSQHGKGTDSDVPVKVQGLPANTTFAAVAAGQGHSLALTNDGKLYAWGSGIYGQLGNNNHGRDASSDTAVPVQGLDGVTITGIAAGGNFSLALNTTTGQAYGWGRDKDGQLGIGPPSPTVDTPQKMSQDGIKFTVIAAGTQHSLAC